MDQANARGRIAVSLWLGLAIFAISFFMPAFYLDSKTTEIGWKCAKDALLVSQAIPAGLINPFLVLFAAFALMRRLPRIQTVLAILILCCTVYTWIYLASSQLAVGNPMWHAGALLVISCEVNRWKLTVD